MQVPLLDLGCLYRRHRGSIDAAIARVLGHQRFVLGAEVEEFEQAMSDYLEEGPRCLGVSSGTSALLLCLMALDVGPRDEVIVPAYSFISTASVVSRLGATPRFVDVLPDTLNLDVGQVGEQLSEQTRAVIPVHLFGLAADIDELQRLLHKKDRSDVAIIEDAAQGLSGRYRGRQLGNFGRMACFSFFPSKNLGGFGDGGLVATHDSAVAERLDSLRRHGQTARYHHEWLGINGRLDALQAAILGAKLPHLDGWTEERRANAERYRALFDTHELAEHVALPAGDGVEGTRHAYNQFNIRVMRGRRDALRQFLRDADVGTAIYYPTPLPYQRCFASLGHQRGAYPVSEQAADSSLAIPVYPGLTTTMQEYVVERIAAFFA
jgi:dTDP-4-amino-4,6-dideoxygalactose transaminase